MVREVILDLLAHLENKAYLDQLEKRVQREILVLKGSRVKMVHRVFVDFLEREVFLEPRVLED